MSSIFQGLSFKNCRKWLTASRAPRTLPTCPRHSSFEGRLYFCSLMLRCGTSSGKGWSAGSCPVHCVGQVLLSDHWGWPLLARLNTELKIGHNLSQSTVATESILLQRLSKQRVFLSDHNILNVIKCALNTVSLHNNHCFQCSGCWIGNDVFHTSEDDSKSFCLCFSALNHLSKEQNFHCTCEASGTGWVKFINSNK